MWPDPWPCMAGDPRAVGGPGSAATDDEEEEGLAAAVSKPWLWCLNAMQHYVTSNEKRCTHWRC